jgi:hypothetical protein
LQKNYERKKRIKLSKIPLKRFNKLGEKKFSDFFSKKLKNKKLTVPFRDLKDEKYTEEISKDNILIDLDLKFNSSYDFGKYIHEKIKDIKDARFDTGLFHWITLAYFNNLFPGPRGGAQTIKYILDPKTPGSWKKHLVRLRWELYERFKEKSIVYLSKPVNNWSDEEESISASPTLISSEEIINLYKKLYFRTDKKNNHSIISSRNITGNHRDLTKELSIYQLNFDLTRMKSDQILDLLGDDFKKWLKK